MEAFARRVGSGATIVLDGGLATELERRGADLRDSLWSAKVLLEDPDLVRAAHLAYLEAGAEVVITASYQASFQGFAACGLDERAAAGLMRRSVDLAREACDVHGRGAVAASVGPYGAVLGNGAEYTGDYPLGARELGIFHARRLEVLDAAGADVLAVETIPSIVEAAALVRLLERCATPAWISFTCRDGKSLRDGTPFAEAVSLASACDRVIAIGVNCTAPRHLGSLIEVARSVGGKPVVAYPNRGAAWDAHTKTWSDPVAAHDLAAMASAWSAGGAGLVGGCCGTGPLDIAAIARAVGVDA
ncbi:MAG: homocysteine S-methyltransferase [Actinomycetota bacterium]